MFEVLLILLLYIGDIRYNIVFPKGRERWIMNLLEDKKYSHLNTLLDDVIKLSIASTT